MPKSQLACAIFFAMICAQGNAQTQNPQDEVTQQWESICSALASHLPPITAQNLIAVKKLGIPPPKRQILWIKTDEHFFINGSDSQTNKEITKTYSYPAESIVQTCLVMSGARAVSLDYRNKIALSSYYENDDGGGKIAILSNYKCQGSWPGQGTNQTFSCTAREQAMSNNTDEKIDTNKAHLYHIRCRTYKQIAAQLEGSALILKCSLKTSVGTFNWTESYLEEYGIVNRVQGNYPGGRFTSTITDIGFNQP